VTGPTAAQQAARRARLAGALRENLHRRRAQSQARRPDGPDLTSDALASDVPASDVPGADEG